MPKASQEFPRHPPYLRQSRRYSCGPACAWMMLRALRLRASERRLIRVLGAGPRRGTWPEDWAKLAAAFPLAVATGHDATLRQLEARRRAGWQQTLLVTHEGPHYVLYLGRDGDAVLLHDPWDGPVQRLSRREFLRRWRVEDIWSSRRVFQSRRWAVAIRRAGAAQA